MPTPHRDLGQAPPPTADAATPRKLTVKIENFKPLRSNSLFGFADIIIPELHLRIREATIHENHGRRWVGLPAKPQVTREGTVRRDERGKTIYNPVLQFTDTATRDAFSQRVIAVLLETFPNAFDDEAAA
jgi:hypothetical protein